MQAHPFFYFDRALNLVDLGPRSIENKANHLIAKKRTNHKP